MSDTKTSALPFATTLTGGEPIAVVQGAPLTLVQTTTGKIAALGVTNPLSADLDTNGFNLFTQPGSQKSLSLVVDYVLTTNANIIVANAGQMILTTDSIITTSRLITLTAPPADGLSGTILLRALQGTFDAGAEVVYLGSNSEMFISSEVALSLRAGYQLAISGENVVFENDGYLTITSHGGVEIDVATSLNAPTEVNSDLLVVGTFSIATAHLSSDSAGTLTFVDGGTGNIIFAPGPGGVITILSLVLDNGATGARPASPVLAQCFYDSTLKIPIFYDGSHWKNAAGTIV